MFALISFVALLVGGGISGGAVGPVPDGAGGVGLTPVTLLACSSAL